jgi:hypothetical protein
MSTPDGVMLFAESQPRRMHFEIQHALTVRGPATFLKSRPLQSIEGLTHCAERRKSLPPDTGSRLLTEMRRARICSRPLI